jgi:hypothetical protein
VNQLICPVRKVFLVLFAQRRNESSAPDAIPALAVGVTIIIVARLKALYQRS